MFADDLFLISLIFADRCIDRLVRQRRRWKTYEVIRVLLLHSFVSAIINLTYNHPASLLHMRGLYQALVLILADYLRLDFNNSSSPYWCTRILHWWVILRRLALILHPQVNNELGQSILCELTFPKYELSWWSTTLVRWRVASQDCLWWNWLWDGGGWERLPKLWRLHWN